MKNLNDMIVLPVIRVEKVNLQQAVHNSPPPFNHIDRPLLHYSATPTSPVYCVLCSDLICDSISDSICQCSQFLQLSYRGRRDECHHHRLCYTCLNTEHLQSSCQEKCETCGGQHHGLSCHTAVTLEAGFLTWRQRLQVFRLTFRANVCR